MDSVRSHNQVKAFFCTIREAHGDAVLFFINRCQAGVHSDRADNAGEKPFMKVGAADMGISHTEFRIEMCQVVTTEPVALSIANEKTLKRNFGYVEAVGEAKLSQHVAAV